MQRLRASRATTPSRGFITRAASALIFIGATALAFALPGDAAERNSLTPSFSEWRESGSPAPAEETNGHWLGADVGTFRITRGDALHDRIFRAVQDRVHQEPEKAAREVHSLVVGDAAGREKLRQMLLNAAEGKEMMTALDLDSWWQSYTDSYLLDLADAGVNEVLQYSEERMLARLGFVKNVNLEYRTPLGGRTGYGALSFLGALAEKEDSVVAWQLRASHNEDAESGLNAGLIFRHARDKYAEGDLFAGHPMLLGLNAFLDFETHAAGNFLRYSIGGEIRTGALDLYGNYYIPLSDTKEHEGLAYYSAEGFDVEANVGVPGADWLSGVVGYYWWEGEGALEDEEGTKFGFRARPNTSWEFEFEYDLANEGDQEIGGRLSYTRQIGDQPSFNVGSRPFGGNFNPRNHFYDVVRRQYAQRIRSYVAGPSDPVIIPTASSVPGMVVIPGIVTLMPSNTGVNASLGVTYPIVGVATVMVSGADAVVGLGFGSDDASGTVGFTAGEYVFDIPARAIIVGSAGNSGKMYWDDPSAKWAQDVSDDSGATVALFGTGLTMDVATGAVSGFRLYEGQAEAPGATPETPLMLDCSQGGATSATAAEGRVRTGTYITECYGDLAVGNATDLNIGGVPLVIDTDYANPVRAQLSAGSGAMLTMQGTGRGGGSPVISFTADTEVGIQNDVAGGMRFVDGDGFSIDTNPVGCSSSGNVLVRSGGVSGFCASGLADFLNAEVAPVGIGSGFTTGNILTVEARLMGADLVSYELVSAPEGLTVEASGNDAVISGNGGGLADGVHNVEIQRDFGAIPGVHEGDSRVVNVEVHKLPATFTQNVVIEESDAAIAFVGVDAGKIVMIGDLRLSNAVFSNVQAGDLAGTGVSYSAAGVFSLDSGALAESDIGVLGNLTVDVTADNIRGTHQLAVKVEAVNILQIESQYQVPGGAVEAAILDGTTGRVTDLTPGVSDASKVGLAYKTDTEGANVTPAGQVELTDPLGASEASKVVAVEIVHTPTPAYSASGRPFPNPNQTEYPVLTVNVNVTVWKLDAPAAQDKSTSSTPEADGRDPSNVAATFDLPANPAGSGIDFATGGSWLAVGTPAEELEVLSSGEVRGSPYDQDPSVDGEYTINLTASFMHPSLGSALDVVMNLLVVDFTAPATIVLSPGANGQLVAYANGSSLAANANSEVTVASKTVVEVVAIPAPGYRVSAWTESGADSADCASNGGVGDGGRKSCIFTAGNDKDYDIAVEFVSGALPADLVALASGGISGDEPFPAEGPVLEAACVAFGGSVSKTYKADGTLESSACNGAFNEAGTACGIHDLRGGLAGGTCFAGGVTAFKNILACNVQNMKAADLSATCGAACSSGEVAVGGSCVTPANAQVIYSQPTKGATNDDKSSSLQVFRAYGDYRGVISSGENVPQGVWLSLRANPGEDHFVSDWVGCTDGDLGDLTSVGDAQSCVAYVPFGSAALTFDVSLRAEPSGFDAYPLPLTGDIAAVSNDDCTAMGGIVDDYGDPGGGFADCTSYVDGSSASCSLETGGVGEPGCPAVFTQARDCNVLGLLLFNDVSCDFTRKCPVGEYVRAGNCSGGSAPVQGLPDHLDPADFRDGQYIGDDKLFHRIGAYGSDADRFFFRAALSDSVGRNVDGWGGAALPDIHPGLVTVNGNVTDEPDNCTRLGGTLIPAPPATGAFYCTGASRLNFCVVQPHADSRFGQGQSCAGDGKLFNRVLSCNRDENKPTASRGACELEACAEGLEARGSKCIVVGNNGEEASTLLTGDISPSVTYSDPPPANPSNTMVEDTPENCTNLGGTLIPAPPATGAFYCTGASRLNFCVVQPHADSRFGQGQSCAGEGKLFNRVLLCNRDENKPTASRGACELEPCQNGLIARGASCVAPDKVTDGLLIQTPSGGGQLTVTGLSVGVLNENLAAGMYTVNAQPDAGYHVSKWLGNCVGKGEASPYKPSPQSCVLEKKDDEGLVAGVEFKRGLLHPNVLPVLTATIITSPTEAICNGFGGTQQVTLGTGNSGVTYCNGFNQDDAARDPEDENIEDQCWISGGDFIGDDSSADTSVDGNIQRCSRAFVVARECNKRNMRSASILPEPAPDSAECDGSLDTCAPQSFARAQNQPSNELLCGDPCEADEIAFGGKCVTEASAAAGTWVVVE